jgi:hypothetical protein
MKAAQMATVPMMAPIIAGVWFVSGASDGVGVEVGVDEDADEEDVDDEDVDDEEEWVDEGLGVGVGSTSTLEVTDFGGLQLSML